MGLGCAATCNRGASERRSQQNGNFPQLQKTWQTGETDDLSFLLASGLALWMVYGFATWSLSQPTQSAW